MSTYPTTTLPNFITGFVSTASLEQKQCLLKLLNQKIEADINVPPLDIVESNPPSPQCSEKSNAAPIISDYVEHINDLDISDDLSCDIMKELTSLKLRSRGHNGKPAKVKTQWLSPNDIPYKYGKVINNPLPINDFPNIMTLMDKVNSHPDTSGDMTSCLVSCMSTAKSSLSYHADDETLIAQDSDICTVSFGPERTLDFIWKTKNRKGRKGPPPSPDYSVPATNHSMNIMRPGCQTQLQHRVPPGKDSGVRYSLSFRKIVLPNTCETDQTPEAYASLPPSPAEVPSTSSVPGPKIQRKKIVLLAGDSYFERLDEKRLGKGKQEVYKVAKGGRKISQVQQAVETFVKEHPNLEVKTLFVCVGTNDIRHCQQGISHLKPVLCEFMKALKALLPNTKIFFQSLLPIPANGNSKMEINVVHMNSLIYNVCSRYRLYYIDVFRSFLNPRNNRNLDLFPAYDNAKKFWDIHPNAKGMGVLAKHYIFLIHSKWFNPQGY